MTHENNPPDGFEYGRSLTGFGINLLVTDITALTRFLADIFELKPVYSDHDFAIIRHDSNEFMLHHDRTYGDNPMLTLTGDGAIRGVGVELRLYGVDPDAACARASKQGYVIIQPATNKPHGLREAYIAGPDHYIWVPGTALPAKPS